MTSNLSLTARSFILNALSASCLEFGGKHDKILPSEYAIEAIAALVTHDCCRVELADKRLGSIKVVRTGKKFPKSELTYDRRQLIELVKTAPHAHWRMREKGRPPLTLKRFRQEIDRKLDEHSETPGSALN